MASIQAQEHGGKPLQILFAQLLAQVRAEGYAVFADVLFVLNDESEETSLRMLPITKSTTAVML